MTFTHFRFSLCVPLIVICIMGVPLTGNCNSFVDADSRLLIYISENMENKFLDVTIPTIQQMGEPWFYLGVCALLCAYGDEKMYETGKLAAAAFLEAGFAAYLLKHAIGRPRPEDTEEKGTSFPSGHSAMAFTIATIAGHEYRKLRIPLYIAASGVAFARVYVNEHYPSDVISGAAIGILAGMSIIHFRKPILQLSF